MVAPFLTARLPRILFGEGRFREVARECRTFGTSALVVTGGGSLDRSGRFRELEGMLAREGIRFERVTVSREPSPELVDGAVAAHRGQPIDVVLGVGGGSALDAAKAIAGLLHAETTALDHLEGVGRGLPYRGPAVPFLAVPTTAGTGSEATKNAVLSRAGEGAFKKSLRDEQLVARVAIVDPDLLASCPPEVMAANGMDAFTQLLEAFVSTGASAFTDAIAWSGMEAFARGFAAFMEGDGDAARAGRSDTAYAALCSGIALAQAGLGSVHGLASPLGALFPIPHGVVCGTLVAEAIAVNVAALRAWAPGSEALGKYARAGRLLAGVAGASIEDDCARLVDVLRQRQERWALPRLSRYGVRPEHLPAVASEGRAGSGRTNPIALEDGELLELLSRRL